MWSRALAVEGMVGELLPTPMCDASGNSGRGVQDGLLGYGAVSSVCNSGLPEDTLYPKQLLGIRKAASGRKAPNKNDLRMVIFFSYFKNSGVDS